MTAVAREHLTVALGSGPYRPGQILVPRKVLILSMVELGQVVAEGPCMSLTASEPLFFVSLSSPAALHLPSIPQHHQL
jgi:hypothetical protein